MSQKLQFNPQKRTSNGKTYWRIRVGNNPNGSKKYIPCDDENHAKREQRKLLAKQARDEDLGKEALGLVTQEEINFCVKELAAIGASLRDATEWFVKTNSRKFGNKTANEAGDLFLTYKNKSGLKSSTIGNYEPQINRFVEYFDGRLVNDISSDDLQSFVEWSMQGMSNNTIAPRIGFLRLFFKWLQDQGYIHNEKAHPASKLVRPKRDLSTPKIASWIEAKRMMMWYDALAKKREEKKGQAVAANIRGAMVHLALILFCGIRREEACQATWADIDIDGRFFKVLVEGAKKNRRRVNQGIEDNFWHWMIYLKDHNAKLGEGDGLRRLIYYQRQYRESFRDRNAPVPDIVATVEGTDYRGKRDVKAKFQNIMRHSFISYHMKLYDSAAKTSRLAGNSESEILRSYLEVVTDKKDAQRWFMIRPPVTLEDLEKSKIQIETGGVSIDDAYKASLEIQQLKEMSEAVADDEDAFQEIAKEIWQLQRTISAYEKQEPDNLHKLAKRMEWGAHNEDIVFDAEGNPLLRVE